MTIERHPNFKRTYKKRIATDAKLVKKTRNRIQIFMDNPKHPLLRDHALKGGKEGLRAFSVTGDIRITYRRTNENEAEFLDIGTHNQVYS
ncbi:type II toxin-antitoxin system mRNA interferase toxin, RelE/StbE family [Candidatus Gottesmanbacteria bacterium]|nr:type II toxin-antitoxin system mRNA interferase toxin, RelE/StbE family [Candidatus Gottesmanbacteria bacterium]